MAQVISHYTATVGGNSAMYYYKEADNTSSATRIYTGTAVTLPVDYESRLTNRLYPTIDPGGWIYAVYFRNITPVYKTVTDACTAPSSLTLNTASKTLTITGGKGGDLNALTGFGVSWRERQISNSVWGAWSAETFTSSRSISVEANSGMVRQYRARTRGEAGSQYYSTYTVCDTLLIGNTAAGTPVVLLPVSGTQTCASAPVVKIQCPADADGDTMTLQRSLDGGAWVNAATLPGSGGVAYDPVSVGTGSHTVRYRLRDANGEGGGEDSITFSRINRSWKRTISTGNVIANHEISFVADIMEMLERVNLVRTFYGLSEISLPGTPGRAADWKNQLAAMQAALNECAAVSGRGNCGFASTSAWPNAQEINQLRTVIQTL